MDLEIWESESDLIRLANTGSIVLYEMSLYTLMKNWNDQDIDFTQEDFLSLLFAGLVEENRILEAENIIFDKYSIKF